MNYRTLVFLVQILPKKGSTISDTFSKKKVTLLFTFMEFKTAHQLSIASKANNDEGLSGLTCINTF